MNNAPMPILCAALLAAALCTNEASGAELHVGGATVSITPKLPVALSGQRHTRVATSVESPVTATALGIHAIPTTTATASSTASTTAPPRPMGTNGTPMGMGKETAVRMTTTATASQTPWTTAPGSRTPPRLTPTEMAWGMCATWTGTVMA